MNRIVLLPVALSFLLSAPVCVTSASAGEAPGTTDVPVDATDPVPAPKPQRKSMLAPAPTAKERRAAENDFCKKFTGSRIKHDKRKPCPGVNGAVYTRDDLADDVSANLGNVLRK
jgi:hypothetical protein